MIKLHVDNIIKIISFIEIINVMNIIGNYRDITFSIIAWPYRRYFPSKIVLYGIYQIMCL